MNPCDRPLSARLKRDLIAFASRCLLALVVGACARAGSFSEAPELERAVRAGLMPRLELRLPDVPAIVSPVEKPGTYGGSWRMVLTGYEQGPVFSRCLGYEQLVRWDLNWSRAVPNLASGWTINSNATVYRFTLRKGTRWSDGQPFTAHDVVAWVDDVARNPELSPDPPAWLVFRGRLPECVAVEDHVLEFRFAVPNALFLDQLAGMRANEMTRYAAHYHRPVHRRHNPSAAEELALRMGVPWPEAFRTRFTPWTWRNPDMPTLDAWVLASPYLQGVTNVIARRNPYYWKIDTLGRQLPYMDRVEFAVVQTSAEAGRLMLSGAVDYQREGLGLARGDLLEAEQRGRLATVKIIPSVPGGFALSLNLAHRNPLLREALGDRTVRIALSTAIDRPRIIQEVLQGNGRPWQIAPRPESPFHNAVLGTQFTGFDLREANALLDGLGFKPDPGSGVRRLKDGSPFAIKILVPEAGNMVWPAILGRIQETWKQAGVAMEWEVLPREEFYRRVRANQHDAALWWGGGGHSATLEPEFYVPVTFERLGPLRVPYAVPWARWFLNPGSPDAEEPPPKVRAQMEIFRKMLSEPSSPARTALMNEVIRIAAEQFYVIGISLDGVEFAGKNPAFRNVPSSHFDSWLYPDPGPLNPCQFFLDPSKATTR